MQAMTYEIWVGLSQADANCWGSNYSPAEILEVFADAVIKGCEYIEVKRTVEVPE